MHCYDMGSIPQKNFKMVEFFVGESFAIIIYPSFGVSLVVSLFSEGFNILPGFYTI